MKHLIYTFCLFLIINSKAHAQPDSARKNEMIAKIIAGMKEFQPDTTTPPQDKLTESIKELRSLKGGFNIQTAIEIKIAEEREKAELPKEQIDRLADFLQNGKGKLWLENASIWIYRAHFSYKDIRSLIKFYKTDAGQKYANEFPLVVLEALASGEMIKRFFK
jgi:hypothetical protein